MNIPTQYKDQIKAAWAPIQRRVEFVLVHSGESSYLDTFRTFINETVELHPQFIFRESVEPDEAIHMKLFLDGEDSGVAFQGIPLGHELTSFVLAPLAITGQAKMPDERTIGRIKALRGRIEIQSYVSLSCENCPAVVQALNMFAALNPNIQHVMIEGGMNSKQVEEDGVLSVPTVKVNGELFSTGRQELSQLLDKLESQFGSVSLEEENVEDEHYDVVIVGGGPSGISAAIYTARKGLKTAIVSENIGGLVKETKGIENMISTLYIEGPELAQSLRNHLEAYPVDIYENQRVEKLSIDQEKTLLLKGGLRLHTPILIAATGARWRELQIPGEKEYLGRGVAFCPHCDGPFYKDKEIAVVGGGNSGAEAALDLAGICKKVTVLEKNNEIRADQILYDKLKAKENIEIVTNAKSIEIKGDGKKVSSMLYEQDGLEKELQLSAVFVQIGLVPNSNWIADHVEVTPYGEIQVNEKSETSQSGVFAAGDVSTVPYKQIVIAMGEGAKAGLTAFEYHMKKIA